MKSHKVEIKQYETTVYMTDCPKRAARLALSEGKEKQEFTDCAGMTYFNPAKAVMVLYVADTKLSTLCHEIIHAIDYISCRIGADIHADSEPWAYLGDHLFKEYLENIWEIHDKQ